MEEINDVLQSKDIVGMGKELRILHVHTVCTSKLCIKLVR